MNGFTSCIFAPDGLIGQAATLAMRRSTLVAQDKYIYRWRCLKRHWPTTTLVLLVGLPLLKLLLFPVVLSMLHMKTTGPEISHVVSMIPRYLPVVADYGDVIIGLSLTFFSLRDFSP